MAKSKNTHKATSAPALTTEGRENQMIALAIDETERRIRDGSASSQVLVHYLKLGTTRNQLETDRLRSDIELTKAKTKALAAQESNEKLFKEAIDAMRKYGGHEAEYED